MTTPLQRTVLEHTPATALRPNPAARALDRGEPPPPQAPNRVADAAEVRAADNRQDDQRAHQPPVDRGIPGDPGRTIDIFA